MVRIFLCLHLDQIFFFLLHKNRDFFSLTFYSFNWIIYCISLGSNRLYQNYSKYLWYRIKFIILSLLKRQKKMAQLQKCFRETCEWLSIDRKSLKNCGSNSFWKGTKLVYKKIAQKCRLKHTIGESGQKSHYRKYCYQSWKMNLWQNIYQNVRLELEIWYLHHLAKIWKGFEQKMASFGLLLG